DLPGGGTQEPGHGVEQGGLACPVGADDPHHLVVVDAQVHIGQNLHAAHGHRDPAQFEQCTAAHAARLLGSGTRDTRPTMPFGSTRAITASAPPTRAMRNAGARSRYMGSTMSRPTPASAPLTDRVPPTISRLNRKIDSLTPMDSGPMKPTMGAHSTPANAARAEATAKTSVL